MRKVWSIRFFTTKAQQAQNNSSLATAVAALEQQLFAERESYPALLQWCGREKCLHLAKRIHAHLTRSGFRNDVFLANLIIQMYSRCFSVNDARCVFDSMPLKNAFTWNIMIAAYSQAGDSSEAFAVFDKMWVAGVRPVHRPVLALLVRGSSSLADLRVLHARMGIDCSSDAILSTEMMRSYGTFGRPEEAARVFENLSGRKDAICWTALVSVYAHNMRGREALEIFKRMDSEPDQVAFVSAIDACSVLGDLNEGALLHCRVLQEGFRCHVLATSLVTFYGRCGRVEAARRVFEQHRDLSMDVVSWNAMIAAYAQNGMGCEAIEVFDLMTAAPNVKTFATVLDACASIGALEKGKSVHARIDLQSLIADTFLSTALVSMYGRCGLVHLAESVFHSMLVKDPVAWTAMISALAQNGKCADALDLFFVMTEEANLRPDWVTYVGVLTACSHGGLIEDGVKHFNGMREEYEIQPAIEHFGCMIDLLGRTGRLAEAEEVMKSIPFDPNEVTWTAFLNACRIHGDVERGVVAAEAMFKLEPGNAEPYVALANIYSSAGREEDAKKVKARLAEVRRIKSTKAALIPGVCLIEVGNAVHAFSAGSARLHPRFGEIVMALEKLEGFHKGLLEWDDLDEERVLVSGDHSEKLALGFGLFSSNGKNSGSLHIVKNERMCGDCHWGFKAVSKGLVGRVITVRDTKRIHRFENGGCSCGGYW